MDRRRMNSGQPANDLIGTWKKLFGYCKNYMFGILLALLCAVVERRALIFPNDELISCVLEVCASLSQLCDATTA
jgi:hypothetical protein